LSDFVSKKQQIEDFTTTIEAMCREGMEYTEAIVTWCEEHGVDVEFAAALVKKSPTLLSNMEISAAGLRQIKQVKELPDEL